ncbi:tetratricopeptide repeat protein [Oceaniglobus trochenteri]|uniref:tetratricopeptide repeat protein n=1 Tax=Oceaniglobus trochenteri TaxID=2763260 RepID=UPI001CFFFDC8|nr:tetratricopeptide repeat protein [Oceaniglobus trochenteri]
MRAIPFLLILALAACGNTGGLARDKDSPYAPRVARADGSVDGLLVGHRLMEAGEYELALKAYYRAAGNQGTTVDVLSALGSANLRLGRLGQAERLLRQAVKKDETFVPAWNNLGVVLMERRNFGEAERVFRTAFALDSGESDDIKANLALALAKIENPAYDSPDISNFALVRRGSGDYRILSRI